MANVMHEIDVPFHKATFAMGCFWANDALFGATPGVLRTCVGYSGGTTSNPTYKSIGDHTEVIEIHFDPEGITYQQLLQMFWNNHEYGLTTKIKKQYASLILYHDNEQKEIAEQSMKEEKMKHSEEMCTEIKPAAIFYPAEEQVYVLMLQQHRDLCKVLMLTPELLQKSHVAARLNGYVAGVGTQDALDKDLTSFKLEQKYVDYVKQVFARNKGSGLMEDVIEDYLVNYDNIKDFKNCEYHKRFNQFQKEPTSTQPFWNNLLQTQFEDERLSSFFVDLSDEDRAEYFKFGIDCFTVFIQANFTGPALPHTCEEFLGSTFFNTFDFKLWLSVDEELNVNTKHSALLVAGLCIFKWCRWNLILNLWWHWRGLMVHQRVLDELSPKLLENVNNVHKQLQDLHLIPHQQALLEIEQAELYQVFRNVTQSETHLCRARELLGITHELVGALGRRTKYQQTDIAQLTLSIKLSEDSISSGVVEEFPIPNNLLLDDDLRLDKIKFSSEIELPKFLTFIRKEIKPFFDYILNQNNTWVVRAIVILMRCKLESTHKRTITRCLLQCEDVVNYMKKEEPHVLNRLGGIFSTNFPPKWEIEAQLAELMLNTGLIKASLEIFLRLELWEDVIVCYTLLKLRHKAADVIRQRLEAQPTVKLWCLLGDATDDVTCYEKAWEMSEKRSSRAQRHWGEYFYFRKHYQKCIIHFEKSLSINPLQVNVWLRYGFAALETGNWQVAATAYKRYTMLEPGNFQAWNNLAKAYVKLGNKHAAHQALHDAIKFNFDNWKVWDNLMAVSVDIKNFSDVANAYHRILDLKEKHLDLEVLQALVMYLVSTSEDVNASLLKRSRELFGRLTTIYPGEGFLWELYAELALDNLTRIQRLQKAYKGLTQEGWEKSLEKCESTLFVCSKLGKLILGEDIISNDSLLHSVRLNISSCATAVKKQSYDQLSEIVNEVSAILQLVSDKCKVG
ncbi:hypothetical protein FQR65_LT05766 [Abscondita terminalis]|nr:hypothetical protein FQR65_LT05766 [Abscondita terminalis]